MGLDREARPPAPKLRPGLYTECEALRVGVAATQLCPGSWESRRGHRAPSQLTTEAAPRLGSERQGNPVLTLGPLCASVRGGH